MNEEDNPYGVLGLGLGGADVTEAEIKKARPCHRAATPQPHARAGVSAQSDRGASGQAPARRARACAPIILLPPRLTPSGAESEFNALAKAYELLWRVARSARARADAPQRRRGAGCLGRLGCGSQRAA